MPDNIFLNVSHNFAKAQQSWNSLGKTVKSTSSAFNGANKNLNKMQGSLRNLNADANRSVTSFGNLGKAVNNVNFAATTAKIVYLSKAIARLVQSSMDSIEVVNMFNVAMGNLAVETNDTLVKMSELTGLDLTNLQQATGTFNNLARSMGLTNDVAQKISLNAVQMATDMSSLFNIPFEQVLADFRSGLIGQTETVYKYGLDLTEASLKQEALRLGITKSVREMTQGEKMFLRMSKAMQSSTLAVGDFARTIEQPANQIRLLGENVTTLGRTIGSLFIPMLSSVIPYVRAFVMVLTELFSMLASLFGFVAPEIENTNNGVGSISGELDDATASAGGLKKALKDLSAPFDELNAINIDASTGGGGVSGGTLDPAILASLQEYDSMMANVKQKANSIRDSIMEWLGFTKQIDEETGKVSWKLTNTRGFINDIKKLLAPTVDSFKKLSDALEPLKSFTAYGLMDFYRSFLKPIGEYGFSDLIPGIVDSVTTLVSSINFDNLYEAFHNVWTSLYPIVEEIGDLFLWLLNEVLAPLAGWTISNVLPAFLNVLSSALEILHSVIEFVKPLLSWLWDYFLKPIASWTGGVIVTVLNGIATAFEYIAEAVDSTLFDLSSWFDKELWIELGDGIKQGVVTKWNELIDWWANTGIPAWWDGHVVIWFEKETWVALAQGIKDGIVDKWNDVVNWWNNTAIVTWWNDSVKPWFTKEKWVDLLKGMKDGFVQGWKNAVNGAIEILNSLIRWINKHLKFDFDGLNIAGQEIVPAFSFELFQIPEITPLARGGMIEAGSIFQAGEAGAELIGNYGGKTTVMPLENSGFVEAMYDAVFSAVSAAQEAGGGQVIENILTVDGDVLYKSQKKVESRKGVSFGSPAFAR